MRWILGLAVLLWTAPALLGQEDGAENKPEAGDEAADGEKKPEEPPVFKLSDRDLKKVERELESFLVPSRRTRKDEARGLERLVEKTVDGHSFMEDVPALVEIANRSRVIGRKIPRSGTLREIEVPKNIHGFPGGVGTVTYWLRLPEDYRDRELWPVIFCFPDTKAYPDTSKYIEDVWLKSKTVNEKYIVVAPTTATKGKRWESDDIAYARAMIALRHVMGTFDADRDHGGPASDTLRVFVDGEDIAAVVAARFTEMFAGAVLRHSTGSSGRLKMRTAGGLNGLPAFCIVPEDGKRQERFAEMVKSDNEKCVVVKSEDAFAVDPEKIAKWMEGLPRRGIPRKISYTVHDSSFQRHHWINVLRFDATRKDPVGFDATADRATNVVTINNRGLIEFEVSLNDALVDLNREVEIRVVEEDKEFTAFKGKVTRDLWTMLTELLSSNQAWRIYPARVTIRMPDVRRKAAAAEAKKKAEESAAKATEDKGASLEVTGGSLDR